MAMFMAMKIMEGVFDYSILDFRLYERYREEVDAILIAEGKGHLIKNSEREVKIK